MNFRVYYYNTMEVLQNKKNFPWTTHKKSKNKKVASYFIVTPCQ
jgi:hypothetical protein